MEHTAAITTHWSLTNTVAMYYLIIIIKIKSIDGAGIAISKPHQLNDIHIYLGTGIYVDNQFLLLSSRIVVHIDKIYSCLIFHYDRDKMKKIQIHDVVYVVLKNISVDNSTCWSALKFTGSNNMKTNLSLQDVRIVNNKSPILMYANKTLLIHMTGCNSFCDNRGVIYLTNSLLLISPEPK